MRGKTENIAFFPNMTTSENSDMNGITENVTNKILEE